MGTGGNSTVSGEYFLRDTFIDMRSAVIAIVFLASLSGAIAYAETDPLTESLNPSPIPTVRMPDPYQVPLGVYGGSATTSGDSIQTLTSLIAQLQKLQILLATLQFTNASTTFGGSLAVSASVEPEAVAITRTLTRGMSGADVRALQKLLTEEGFLESDAGTGYFGALTQEAVQEYQAHYGIVLSGSPKTTGYGAVGPKTRISVNAALRGAREAQ